MIHVRHQPLANTYSYGSSPGNGDGLSRITDPFDLREGLLDDDRRSCASSYLGLITDPSELAEGMCCNACGVFAREGAVCTVPVLLLRTWV